MNCGELAFIRGILLQKCNKMYLGQTHQIKSCGMNVVMFMQIGNSIQRKKGNCGQFRPNNGRTHHIYICLNLMLKNVVSYMTQVIIDTCMNFQITRLL